LSFLGEFFRRETLWIHGGGLPGRVSCP